MLWRDFYDHFSTISFCLIDDNAHYYYSKKEYDHEKPHYYSLDISHNEGKPIYMIFSQPCQFNHTKYEKIQYSNITVMVTKMEYDANN